MSGNFMDDRRSALEEAFFAEQDAALRRRLREADAERSKKEALSAASGITDGAVLERLAALGIAGDTVAALSLVPLVAVAWADGAIDGRERGAVLAGAAEVGVGRQDVSHQLLDRWLAERPPPGLLAAWTDYARAVSATMDDEAKRALRAQLLGRTRKVAEAAGGVLGIGRKVSDAEEAVLRSLESAFPA
jgi:hypothetical protein